MQISDKQFDFLEKFIGLSNPSSSGEILPEADSSDPLAIWRNGKEVADKSIELLQNALKDKNVAALDQIVEFGLNGLSERNQTDLMKALFEFSMSDAAGRKNAAKILSERAAAYQSFIEGDSVIELCENNPFGVSVDIKKPLVAALSQIKSVATSAAAAD